jgi:hypothetical protein
MDRRLLATEMKLEASILALTGGLQWGRRLMATEITQRPLDRRDR